MAKPNKRSNKKAKAKSIRTRENPPPLYGSTTQFLKCKGTPTLIGIEVYEIRYRHAADGRDYKHPFEEGATMVGYADGSLHIESSQGKKLWEVRNV